MIGTLVGGVTVLATGTLIFAMAPFLDLAGGRRTCRVEGRAGFVHR